MAVASRYLGFDVQLTERKPKAKKIRKRNVSLYCLSPFIDPSGPFEITPFRGSLNSAKQNPDEVIGKTRKSLPGWGNPLVYPV